MRLLLVSLTVLLLVAVIEARRGGGHGRGGGGGGGRSRGDGHRGGGRSRGPPGIDCQTHADCPTGETCIPLPLPLSSNSTVQRCTSDKIVKRACYVNGEPKVPSRCDQTECSLGPFSRTLSNGTVITFMLCDPKDHPCRRSPPRRIRCEEDSNCPTGLRCAEKPFRHGGDRTWKLCTMTRCEEDSDCPTGESCAELPSPRGGDRTWKLCTFEQMFEHACSVDDVPTNCTRCAQTECTVGPLTRYPDGIKVEFRLCERPPRRGRRHKRQTYDSSDYSDSYSDESSESESSESSDESDRSRRYWGYWWWYP